MLLGSQTFLEVKPLDFRTECARNFSNFKCLRYFDRDVVSSVIGKVWPVSLQVTDDSILKDPHTPRGSLSPLLRVYLGFFTRASIAIAQVKLTPNECGAGLDLVDPGEE